MPRSPRPPTARWTPALETALVREIAREWARVNQSHFRSRMVAPTIALVSHASFLGRWVHDTRTIELSRPLVLGRPWAVAIEVLKHEMAHQYVHEALGVTDETAHGPRFREVCAAMGVDAAASGLPSVDGGGVSEEARAIDRITKLLALAGSPNVHEAEAATMAAQRLLLRYNLYLAAARGARGYVHRHLGEPSGRIYEPDRILSTILGRYFFVEVIWVSVYRPLEGRHGSVLEICGTPENVRIAEYVHGFLRATASRLWENHGRAHARRSGRERLVFLAGVMAGVSDKLSRQERTSAEEGLVWVKDADLSGFLRKRYPHIRHVRYGGERRTETYERGRAAGREVVIHKGIETTRSGGALLLPAKR